MDDRVFLTADRLEFVEKDDAQLSTVLRGLARTANRVGRAEALLRLARLHVRQHRIPAALATYRELRETDVVSPGLEVPYALLAGVERSRLLLAVSHIDAARSEIADLRRGLRSGRWMVRKPAFVYYDTVLRQMGDGSTADDPTPIKLAIADAVGSLWERWQMQDQGERPAGQWVYRSADTTVVAVVSGTSDRLNAALLTSDRMGPMVLDAASSPGVDGMTVGLADEGGTTIFGNAAAGPRAVRALNATLPWQILPRLQTPR